MADLRRTPPTRSDLENAVERAVARLWWLREAEASDADILDAQNACAAAVAELAGRLLENEEPGWVPGMSQGP